MPDDTATTIAKKNPAAHLAQYAWKPGQRPEGAGRPKGSRNKLGEEFLAAMLNDFEQHGSEAIVKVREEKPDAYLKVIASILPKELNVNTNALGDMSDDELTAVITAMRTLADSVGAALAGAGAGEAESPQPAGEVRPVH